MHLFSCKRICQRKALPSWLCFFLLLPSVSVILGQLISTSNCTVCTRWWERKRESATIIRLLYRTHRVNQLNVCYSASTVSLFLSLPLPLNQFAHPKAHIELYFDDDLSRATPLLDDVHLNIFLLHPFFSFLPLRSGQTCRLNFHSRLTSKFWSNWLLHCNN